MAREPMPIRPAGGFAGDGTVLGDPPPAEVYPLKRGGRAVPDRSREPVIGPACGNTRAVVEGDVSSPAPRFTEELRSGVDVGSPREDAKTRQEHSDAVTEARHGQATRPPRPGRWG
jgi:hypothetical protein